MGLRSHFPKVPSPNARPSSYFPTFFTIGTTDALAIGARMVQLPSSLLESVSRTTPLPSVCAELTSSPQRAIDGLLRDRPFSRAMTESRLFSARSKRVSRLFSIFSNKQTWEQLFARNSVWRIVQWYSRRYIVRRYRIHQLD